MIYALKNLFIVWIAGECPWDIIVLMKSSLFGWKIFGSLFLALALVSSFSLRPAEAAIVDFSCGFYSISSHTVGSGGTVTAQVYVNSPAGYSTTYYDLDWGDGTPHTTGPTTERGGGEGGWNDSVAPKTCGNRYNCEY